jgi:hypothetical protein
MAETTFGGNNLQVVLDLPDLQRCDLRLAIEPTKKSKRILLRDIGGI